jgi:hypothetical protein
MPSKSLIKAEKAASKLGGASGSARDAILKRKKAVEKELAEIMKSLG